MIKKIAWDTFKNTESATGFSFSEYRRSLSLSPFSRKISLRMIPAPRLLLRSSGMRYRMTFSLRFGDTSSRSLWFCKGSSIWVIWIRYNFIASQSGFSDPMRSDWTHQTLHPKHWWSWSRLCRTFSYMQKSPDVILQKKCIQAYRSQIPDLSHCHQASRALLPTEEQSVYPASR